jgi:hypothetical protein
MQFGGIRINEKEEEEFCRNLVKSHEAELYRVLLKLENAVK